MYPMDPGRTRIPLDWYKVGSVSIEKIESAHAIKCRSGNLLPIDWRLATVPTYMHLTLLNFHLRCALEPDSADLYRDRRLRYLVASNTSQSLFFDKVLVPESRHMGISHCNSQ